MTHRFSLSEIGERDNWTCGICSNPIRREAISFDPWAASVDHIIPLARGGDHSRANVQMAHLWCNITKNAKLPDDLVAEET